MPKPAYLRSAGLLQRGYAEAGVRKILGGNVLRVLQATIG
jgi:microsomal dipeptidase-like Zn-dependent dipeptidase